MNQKGAIMEYSKVGEKMEPETLILLQIAGFATTGGLIGEAYRSVHAGYDINKFFVVNSLASGFLAFLLAWGFYSYTANKNIATVIAGILAFQDEKKVSSIARNTVLHWLKGAPKDDE